MNEKELLKKAITGDSDAFSQLIEPYMSKVYNIALGVLSNPADAEDAAQEALVKAYRHIGSFNENSGFYTWLYRIVYNCCLDSIRKKQRRPFVFLHHRNDEDEEAETEIEDTSAIPENIFIGNETQEEVRRAISMLKESYRTIIVLRDIEGLSYDEIATILDISGGTVKSRLSRARESLKNIIISKFPELFQNSGVK